MAKLIMKPLRSDNYKTFATFKIGQKLEVPIAYFKGVGALRNAACVYSKKYLNGSIISVSEENLDKGIVVISHNLKS